MYPPGEAPPTTAASLVPEASEVTEVHQRESATAAAGIFFTQVLPESIDV